MLPEVPQSISESDDVRSRMTSFVYAISVVSWWSVSALFDVVLAGHFESFVEYCWATARGQAVAADWQAIL